MKKLLNAKILLFGIILIAFLLRFWNLGESPSGFFADEAAFGYNAYSILHTGKDEYGKFLPIVLKSFGDYKGAAYSYFVIPSIAVFGLTSFAVRFPSIIFDILTIIILYLFIKEFIGNKRIALITCLLYAISPWSIIISRITGDVTAAVFFSILMAYSIAKFSKKINFFWLSLSLLSGLVAIFSYAPFRFFVVIIPLIFFLISGKKVKNKITFNKNLLILAVAILLIGFMYSFLSSIARFNQISIFSTPQTKLVLEEQIREDEFTVPVITRFFHNKIVNYTRTFISNAGQYFTLDFLALNGGYPRRERVPDSGLFYIWEIPFLLIGIYVIFKSRNRNLLFFIFWWLFLLTPSFITFDEIPNVHRTIVILPAMLAIIAIGINSILNRSFLKLKFLPILFFIFIVISIFEFSYFLHQYFVHYDKHQAWYRGYPYKGLVEDLQKFYPGYKKIIITKSVGSPYIYILFYSKYDPKKYQAEGSPLDLDYTGFDKYYFVPLDCPPNDGKTKIDEIVWEKDVLYVDKGDCSVDSKDVKVLDTVRWKDGNPAFKLMEYSPVK